MYRQSPRSRGQRSNKGFKARHGLQLILILGVGVWLFYQTQPSYNHKDRSLGEDANVSDRLRLGRKDLPDYLPDFGDAETRNHQSGNVKLGGNEEVVGAGGSETTDEVKKVGNEGMKEENEKTRSVETKGVVKLDGVKSESSGNNVDSGEDKQAYMAAFSDETFASHSQNEIVDSLGAKIGKVETGVDTYQSDLNTDPSLKTGDSNGVEGGDSTTFSDTNRNEEANGVENPGSSLSRAYEKTQSEQPDSSHNSVSVLQEQKIENKKESLEVNNSQIKKDGSSSTDDNVNKEQQDQVKFSKEASKEQKEYANGEHPQEVDSSASEEVKDRTDLDTLPDTDKRTHSKDAVAL